MPVPWFVVGETSFSGYRRRELGLQLHRLWGAALDPLVGKMGQVVLDLKSLDLLGGVWAL